MSIPVMIDDRAGSRDLMQWEPVRSLGQLTRLDSADAAVLGNGPDGPVLVGVEVKSLWDLISSMNTGRLQATQIPAMLTTYDQSWLLYYGRYRPGRNGELEIRRGKLWKQMKLGSRPVPHGYLEMFLLDLAATGIHVKLAYDIGEAAVWLGALHRWWSRDWHAHKGMRTLDNSRTLSVMPNMDPGTYRRACVAAALPGVGFERAISAARHFGSIQAMINAGADEWAQIDGIGKVIGRAVVEAVK